MSLKYRISYKRKDPPLETFDGQTSSIECFPSDGINNVVFEDESAVTNQTRENGNDIRHKYWFTYHRVTCSTTDQSKHCLDEIINMSAL